MAVPRFSYVLNAPTSMAILLREESMTYLDEGELYELSLSSVGIREEELVLSTVQLAFFDEKLQEKEAELIAGWQQRRPRETFLEMDYNFSIGINDGPPAENSSINKLGFFWNSSSQANLVFRVNCLSSEFTEKQYGGQAGIVFRLIVSSVGQTYSHVAACRIKVFRQRGAARTNKLFKDKQNRFALAAQVHFQQATAVTTLQDIITESQVNHRTTSTASTSTASTSTASTSTTSTSKAIYISIDNDIYHPVYLDKITATELISKLGFILNLNARKPSPEYIACQDAVGPAGYKILVTDDVVRKFVDESMYSIELQRDSKGKLYALMKRTA